MPRVGQKALWNSYERTRRHQHAFSDQKVLKTIILNRYCETLNISSSSQGIYLSVSMPFSLSLSLSLSLSHTHTHTHSHACTHAHTRTHARTHAGTHTHARTHLALSLSTFNGKSPSLHSYLILAQEKKERTSQCLILLRHISLMFDKDSEKKRLHETGRQNFEGQNSW